MENNIKNDEIQYELYLIKNNLPLPKIENSSWSGLIFYKNYEWYRKENPKYERIKNDR